VGDAYILKRYIIYAQEAKRRTSNIERPTSNFQREKTETEK